MANNATRSPRRHGAPLTYALLAGGMAVFGSATPVSKIVTSAMPVFVGGGIRVALGALVLAPLAFGKRSQIRGMGRRDWLLVGLIAVFGMFGFSAFMLYGMKLASGVAGATVMSTTPAVTAAGAMLFLKEDPSWRKLVAIGLAVSGVLVLQLGQIGDADSGSGGAGDALLGAALVFAAVCCEAAYTLLGKAASERTDPVLVAALGAALAVPLFVPFAAWQWQDFDPSGIDPRAWAALAWYGAGTLALGSWLWYAGIARVEGAVAAGFMGVMPASALILSYLLLGEPVRLMHLAGFAIVFAGVLLISWEHMRMSRQD